MEKYLEEMRKRRRSINIILRWVRRESEKEHRTLQDLISGSYFTLTSCLPWYCILFVVVSLQESETRSPRQHNGLTERWLVNTNATIRYPSHPPQTLGGLK